jgi:hypothetical protein
MPEMARLNSFKLPMGGKLNMDVVVTVQLSKMGIRPLG